MIELTVALAISGLVLLTARSLLDTLLGGALEAVSRQTEATADANARRHLAQAVAGIDIASSRAGPFVGSYDAFEASLWQRTAGGGFALRRITIHAEYGVLYLGSTAVMTGVNALRTDYLLTPGASATWARSWRSATAPPLAIRMRIERPLRTDTLLLLVGPRG